MFLEDRLPTCVKLGATWSDEYDVIVTRTAANSEYRQLVQPFPVRRFSVSYIRRDGDELYAEIVSLYHRVYGKFAGFRVRSFDDWSSNGNTLPPSPSDQLLEVLTAGSSYQLQKEYGEGGSELSIGLPVRTIFKPVSGTVLLSIYNPTTGFNPTTAFSVDTTTGIVTMSANKTDSITAITQGASTVINVGTHTYVVGDSAYISGVSGMTQINGCRAEVTAIGASTITVAINSTEFSAYTSGGTVNTRPQSGESVYGGFEFDIPVRFDSTFDIRPLGRGVTETGTIEFVELLNP